MSSHGGGGRIRTIETKRNRFTVCPLWPLGNSSICGAGNRNRTYNLLITSQLLYRWAMPAYIIFLNGGNNRDRTCDPLLVRQMLSQLSYASKMVTPRGIEPLLPPWKGGVLTAWPRGHNMELAIGIEPTTCWLQVSCSTVEPCQHACYINFKSGDSEGARTLDLWRDRPAL